MSVRLLVHHREPADTPGAVRRAYDEFAATFAATPGVRSISLLHNAIDTAAYTVVTEWANLAAFEFWRASPAHIGVTTPLTPLQDRTRVPHWEVFAIDAVAVAPASTEARPSVASLG